MMSMQKVFYQIGEINGAWVMSSGPKLCQIDHIVEIYQILVNLLHYSRKYLRKTKCLTLM